MSASPRRPALNGIPSVHRWCRVRVYAAGSRGTGGCARPGCCRGTPSLLHCDMANRLSQIATRTGDDGTTGLGDGTRVPKSHLRIGAMGDVDELNSHIGVLLAE